MTDKILPKTRINAFLETLQDGRDVYAPVVRDKALVWDRVTNAEELVFEFQNTDLSPKEFFFPQDECMMRFVNRPNRDEDAHEAESPRGMVFREVAPAARERVLLNIRPCDARAFSVLDRIFCQDELTHDVYWADKRAKTILIGLACNDPCATCFCTSMQCGPHHQEGLDLLLVDLGDRFLVRVLSGRGESLVRDLDPAGESDRTQAAELKAKAENAMSPGPSTGHLASADVLGLFNAPFWEEVALSCLNCGTCTFCCPTCHCFDIQDEVQGDVGRRIRIWDSCMSWLFTQHASGHNPRSTKTDRVRQRFMHKFSYIPVRRDGAMGCVGCGRCVHLCPVNIDVREVVRLMNDFAGSAEEE
jgi:ferredoxin